MKMFASYNYVHMNLQVNSYSLKSNIFNYKLYSATWLTAIKARICTECEKNMDPFYIPNKIHIQKSSGGMSKL